MPTIEDRLSILEQRVTDIESRLRPPRILFAVTVYHKQVDSGWPTTLAWSTIDATSLQIKVGDGEWASYDAIGQIGLGNLSAPITIYGRASGPGGSVERHQVVQIPPTTEPDTPPPPPLDEWQDVDLSGIPTGWQVWENQPGGNVQPNANDLWITGARFGMTELGHCIGFEFMAKFLPQPNQHCGFGTDYTAEPFAVFSTFASGDGLYARANAATQPLGENLLGNWHKYRVEFTGSDTVQFHVDDVLVATLPAPVGQMRPLLSKHLNDGFVLAVGNLKVRMVP